MVRFRNLRGGQQEEEAPPSEEVEATEEDAPQAEEQEDDLAMAEEDDELEVEMGDEAEDEEAGTEGPAEEGDDLGSGQGDAALKELAARMTVLQSNLENVQGTRGEIEDKLNKMEERMMRLGSLAEAVSSEYNPFIAENSPDEPAWDGGAPAADKAPAQEPAPAKAPPAQEAQAQPEPAPEPEPEPAPTPEPPKAADPEPSQAQDLEEFAGMLGGQAERSDQAEQGGQQGQEAPDATTAAEAFSKDRPQLGDRLESKFMMLEWVDLMLRRVGRANLLDLLEYYEGLGWLDQETKRHVIRVAVGMDAPDRPEEKQRGEWRGDLDLHERSLITIERLHGNDISAADVESLRMDMQRFFGE